MPQNDTNETDFGEDVLDFLYESPTAFHAAASGAGILEAAGFSRLDEAAPWSLEKGGKYYLVRDDSALLAFEAGTGDAEVEGLRIIGAHGDAPGFKLKPGGGATVSDEYVKLNAEVYGSPILATWFDRPLALAGRAAVRSANPLRPTTRLVNLRRPLAVIPNLCIHFNRQANESLSYNRQTDTPPLLCLAAEGRNERDVVGELIAEHLKVKREAVLAYDLFLYEYASGELTGLNGEFLSSPRLDNLSLVYAGLRGLAHSPASRAGKIFVSFDHEEVGSRTRAGADGGFMPQFLERLAVGLGAGSDGIHRILARSLAISADCAHAAHPNRPEAHDPGSRTALGGGIAVKYSAGQKYATNAATAGMFMEICRQAKVPYQEFVNRSDIPGGSTIGPAFSSATSVPTVDVGTPILAMHSARELGSVRDVAYACQAFREFYGAGG